LGLVRLLAMPSLRPSGRAISLGAEAVAFAWDGNHRLLALAGNCCPGSAQIAAIDPKTGTVTGRWPVPGTVVRFARTATGFVFLVGPRNQIGTAHLVAADAHGLRVVRLDWIRAGFVPGSLRSAAISNDRFPALAVDRGSGRAFVVDPDGTVATVALGSLAVSYHLPRTSTSLFARFDRWLEPEAQAKGDNGPWRQAQWLGNGLLAVSGSDWRANGRLRTNVISETLTERPAGLEIINTRTWRVHTLDANADSFMVADGLLLTTGTHWNVTPRENVTSGEGLVAYDPHGALRFRAFAGHSVSVNLVAAGRAYVTVIATNGYEHQRVVDLGTGRVLSRPVFDWPRLLIGDGDPVSG
jgi:DNA-binding beta-propeller fold protein YncE